MKQPQAVCEQFKALCESIKEEKILESDHKELEDIYEDAEFDTPWISTKKNKGKATIKVEVKPHAEDSESVSTVLEARATTSRGRKKEDLKDSGTSLGSSSAISI